MINPLVSYLHLSVGAFIKGLGCALLLLLAGCSSMLGKSDAPLKNTHWQLTEVSGYMITPKEGKKAAYLQFGANGKVIGHSSCNQLFGQYLLHDSMISFSHMASTRMACMGSADETEHFMLEVLKQPLLWVIRGNRLVLFDNEQVAVARFKSVY